MKRRIVLSFATSLILSGSIYAQDTPKELDKIMVTAQKTEQNIQDVPITMSVFDEYLIEDKKIESVEDIAQYTPNFMISVTGIPVMRGLSSSGPELSTSSAMFIDGIPILHGIGFNEELMDIERIEVLKGPQGTLYGKNTQSGAINIITKQPNNKTKAKVELELGEDNKKELSLSVSGPLIQDKFYMGISAKHHEKDGFVKNINLGGYEDDKNYKYGKLVLRATPRDNLDISLISSIKDRDNGRNPVNNENLNNYKEVTSDLDSKDKTSSTMYALKIKYDLGNYQLQSITTKRDIDNTTKYDNDFTNIYERTNHMFKDIKLRNISQELRLSSSTENLNWLVGIYIDKEDYTMDYHYDKYVTMGGGMVFKGHDIYEVDGNSLGLFTHGDYSLTDTLNIIAGIRYDRDTKYFKEIQDSFDPTRLNLADQSNSYSEFSPKLGLNYKLNDTSSIYTNISKGYKSGGYYAFAPRDELKKYEKETLWNYELGTKNSFLDNSLLLNGTIFYMDIDNKQFVSYYDGESYMSNAAKATSKGIELDLNYVFNDNITLFAAYGFNISKFKDFKDDRGDYSDNYHPNAPKYNYTLGVSYRDASGYFTRINLNGYAKRYIDKENTLSKEAYEVVNTKIGYETSSYDIYLYANNLFDKEYDSLYTSATTTIYSQPREIGMQLAYKF